MLDFSKVSTAVDPAAAATAAPKLKPAPQYQPVAPYRPLDLELAKKNLAVYEGKIQELKKKMDAYSVDSDRAAAVCTEMVALAANLIKTMEKNRKDTIADADGFVRAVNRFVKIYRDQVDGLVKAGKKKLGAWAYHKEQKRREAEAAARQATAKIQAEINKKAKKQGFEPVELPAMVIPPTTGPVRTESGSAATRMVWTWDVTDGDAVPRNYLTIDTKAIDAAIKAGLREIPGLRIFEKPEVRIRTA